MRRLSLRLLVTLIALDVALSTGASAQSLRLGSELQVNLYTVQNQTLPVVAGDADGDAVITWTSEAQDGNSSGVFARRFASDGAASNEFQVNVTTLSFQRVPAIAASANGGFVVAWNGFDGDYLGVFARRVSSAGTPVAGEFQVNTYTTDDQRNIAVAVDADGEFVVVWQTFGQDGPSDGIFGRRFSSNGTAQAGEFQINAYTLGDQKFPAIAAEPDGDFIVVWQRNDGSNDGLFARQFSSAGVGVGSEFQVNVATVENQRYPSIGADSTGAFVVAWQSNVFADGSEEAVVARRFSSTGTPIASEFRVNEFTPNSQQRPSIAVEPDGEFLIVWSSPHDDLTAGGGVFARLFSAAAVPLNQEFQVNSHTPFPQNRPSVAAGGNRFVVAWQSYFQDGDMVGVFGQRLVSPVALDVDGNHLVEPLTDTILALRYAFGFRGAVLVSGAIGANCTRCDAPSIEAYLLDLAN